MTIKPVATASEHQCVGFLSGDEFKVSAGHTALQKMRAMLAHSGPASRYSQLSLRARAAICYTAKLKPSEYASRDLDDMTTDEREAIRQAIIEIRQIAASFEGSLDRADFLHIPQRAGHDDARASHTLKQPIELNTQARTLASLALSLNQLSSCQGD